LVLIGGCLLINSAAFFIGCGAVGVADGLGRVWGAWFALAVGEGAGRGVVRRVAVCPIAVSNPRIRMANATLERRRSEVTMI
jgi:hypothetical protein